MDLIKDLQISDYLPAMSENSPLPISVSTAQPGTVPSGTKTQELHIQEQTTVGDKVNL